METLNSLLDLVNKVLWHNLVLYIILGAGIVFTVWSGFSQYRALTHGVAVIRGRYDNKDDPGAINHFQALSAALSATVGLGNIAGVAVAIALGGPGAVFWMWMVGIFGMALKLTEVIQSMLFRNTDDPENPHGGPMWVAKEGFRKISPALAPLGALVGGIFCITLLISAVTGGNMFQAWNVAEITTSYFPTIPKVGVGIVLALIVGAVIVGGIKRIGAVAGRLVPLMCGLYLLAAIYVVAVNIGDVPAVFALIIKSAFNPSEASGAFLGGTAGYAFLWGMKRALFSSEAGQGSAPVAHSAAKTNEPVREGVVAGLEPFIDTIVVCTLTSLVVLLSGAWNRGAEAKFDETPTMVHADSITVIDGRRERSIEGRIMKVDAEVVGFLNGNPGIGESPYREWPLRDVRQMGPCDDVWTLSVTAAPKKMPEAARITGPWAERNTVFLVVRGGGDDANTGRDMRRLHGVVVNVDGDLHIAWKPMSFVASDPLRPDGPEVFNAFVGAALTGHAFDRAYPGLGMWLVTIACWLFAVSTMISWSYYGEQAVVYLVGQGGVFPYKLIYCALIILSTVGFITTDTELDGITALGTGVMLWANIPIMIIFAPMAMRAYHDYIRRLKAGQMKGHAFPSLKDVVEGDDVR
ncbi:MAG: sodium:alanine symporter family protein [Phycisphaeraceae bacterium]|nr:sodium:alanine symporter family protein [Phycisphaeraceae bacterium]